VRSLRIGAALLLAAASGINAQVQYASGQNVAPVFEGWERNADGSYNMVFGYLNRNYEEAVDIPVGTANSISIGGETYGDRGQPTHFYPRRQRFLFRVVVPADFDKSQKVVWTLTSRGKTDQAKGWLQPEWELSQDVIVENMGGGVPDPDNKPPELATTPTITVTLSEKATLMATATDDGLPMRQGKPVGMTVEWEKYRGPGEVTFSQIKQPLKDGKADVTASFSAPGSYVLMAVVDDGSGESAGNFGYHCCWTNVQVTVNVTGSGATNGR